MSQQHIQIKTSKQNIVYIFYFIFQSTEPNVRRGVVSLYVGFTHFLTVHDVRTKRVKQ